MRYSIRLLLPLCVLLNVRAASAQMPTISVSDADSAKVFLEHLDVGVQVAGSVATTTYTLTFRNNTSRTLEGGLTFPLPEGVTVSRYAIDINGKLREAVPVDKARGTTVLEAIEARRVDPGLLERVDGNSFRTRIYPLPAGGTRTVVIGYEEALKRSANNEAALRYNLPLQPRRPIPQLSIAVTVLQSGARPQFAGNSGDVLFDSQGNSWVAGKNFTNYQSTKPLSFSIPAPDGEGAQVIMQASGNHYYYLVNTAGLSQSRPRVLPDSLTILWDASLSSRFRNKDRELALLDRYFKEVRNAVVNLVAFRNVPGPAKTFTVRNGSWQALRSELQSIGWDGGTQLGLINFASLPGKEILLFSDGISTFGRSEVMPTAKPVYCIASSPTSNFPALKYLALSSGGALINLSTADDIQMLSKELFEQPIRFLGIKPAKDLEEAYPVVPVSAANGVTVAGITYAQRGELVLQFGYGNTVTQERRIWYNAGEQMVKDARLDRSWAIKKIADLDLRYDANRAMIESLGKRYGLVTRNTSLIVLENVSDYLRYRIEPPQELRDEYDRAIKLHGEQRATAVQNRLQTAENIFNELQSWWKEDYTKKPVALVVPPPPPARPQAAPVATTRVGSTRQASGTRPAQANSRRGKHLSEVVVRRERYARPLIQPDAVQTTISSDNLERVPVQSRSSSATSTKTGDEIDRMAVQNTTGVVALSPNVYSSGRSGALRIGGGRKSGNNIIVDGVQYSGGQLGYSTTSAGTHNIRNGIPASYGDTTGGVISRDSGEDDEDDEMHANVSARSFQFDTAIINQLQRVPAGEQYARYLKLREGNISSPSFYFQVAAYFNAQHRERLGMQVLSNLAELEMENYEVTKMLAYRLKESGEYEAALNSLRKVLQWRPMDPQSYRDYGLALADAGHYQQALDTLNAALTGDIDESLEAADRGIEETIITEINNLIALHGAGLNTSAVSRKVISSQPVDIRVVIAWNMKNTDIDLWVTDPNDEKCFYSHKETAAGGRISSDITQGFGPEQFMLRKAAPGKYKIEVNYYGDRQIKIAGPATVMAEVYTAYGTPQQKRRTIVLQMVGKEEGGVYLGEFDFGSDKRL